MDSAHHPSVSHLQEKKKSPSTFCRRTNALKLLETTYVCYCGSPETHLIDSYSSIKKGNSSVNSLKNKPSHIRLGTEHLQLITLNVKPDTEPNNFELIQMLLKTVGVF